MNRDCPHPKIMLKAVIKPVVKQQGLSNMAVGVSGFCQRCKAELRFLGLPSAPLPDAPSPPGSEDDGTDNREVYLPFTFREGA